MSTEDEYRPPLRVGGWVAPADGRALPPQQPAPGVPSALSTSFLASATATVPAPVAAPERPDPPRHRTAVVACAALAVLTVVGVAALNTGRQPSSGGPRFVTLPTVPTVAAALPVPVGSGPPSAQAGPSSVGGRRSHSTASVAPSSRPAAAPVAPGPGQAATGPATTGPAVEPPAAPAPTRTRTTAPPQRRGPFTVGAAMGLEPARMAGFRVRHRGDQGVVDRIGANSPAPERAGTRFTVRTGLADGACVSFESADRPGHFLRHRSFRLRLDRRDGTPLFAADATFCPVDGRRPGTVVLRSQNYPDRYVSLRFFRLELGRRGTAFTVRPPL
ncbi:hypothetical protein Asp14428_03530 [Actinoplanes sp. NBRC 14428]|uniref:Alpha-L-arabinofuranosidase B-like protein n=1 Tax=Pseudosporangium ferrugineum TaxID=439699 RepID=A0A2T0SI95_9ACTN|nr:AbfB domain-containing protein [Pseudosporangium ferrugineum]PRY33138.1 alpha-L-arabinofuranosidase B-like protein [Pseudosporangium ferrugineum]BCJ48878.1 hypothetical protein Asp14428_03530 [Actinoplanes sp. NBRC 14428]